MNSTGRIRELPATLSARAASEALATLSRPARVLPVSWWDADATVNMSERVKAQGTQRLVRRFGGRR